MAHRQAGEPPSLRHLRVAEQIRHLLAEDFVAGVVHDPRLLGVSITIGEVRVTGDLKSAMVFASALGAPLGPERLEALAHAATFLGGRVARRMNLKYAPRLRFVEDEMYDEAARMTRLMQEERRRLGLEDVEDGDAPNR